MTFLSVSPFIPGPRMRVTLAFTFLIDKLLEDEASDMTDEVLDTGWKREVDLR
jgi:hypothetical protein